MIVNIFAFICHGHLNCYVAGIEATKDFVQIGVGFRVECTVARIGQQQSSME